MKNVVLGSAFALLTSVFTGCIFTSDDSSGDDGGGGGQVIASATWDFKSVSADGASTTPSACPAGGTYDTAAVISVSENDHGTNDISSCTGHSSSTSTCVVDLYDCTAYAGADTLPQGGYWAQFISITNHDGTDVWGDSKAQLTDFTGDNSINVELIDNGGFILASWHLVNGGAATTCADVTGQNGVAIDSTATSNNQLISDAFDCDKGEYGFQYTNPLPADNYALSIGVVDANDQQIGQPTLKTVTIGTNNDIVDIGDIEIDVAP